MKMAWTYYKRKVIRELLSGTVIDAHDLACKFSGLHSATTTHPPRRIQVDEALHYFTRHKMIEDVLIPFAFGKEPLTIGLTLVARGPNQWFRVKHKITLHGLWIYWTKEGKFPNW